MLRQQRIAAIGYCVETSGLLPKWHLWAVLVGGQAKRVLSGRYPAITTQAAHQSATDLAREMGRSAGRVMQTKVPNTLTTDTSGTAVRVASTTFNSNLERYTVEISVGDRIHTMAGEPTCLVP